jgi:hypothetical protein
MKKAVALALFMSLASRASAQSVLHISSDRQTSTLTTSRGTYTTTRQADGSGGATYTTKFEPKGYNPMGGSYNPMGGSYKPLGR